MASIYKIEVCIKQGRDLVAKDRDILGRKTTSDPYIELHFGNRLIGTTGVIEKTLNPVWKNERFNWIVGSATLERKRSIELRIWDKDFLSSDDPMGNVFIAFPDIPCHVEAWCHVNCGVGHYYCPNATGEILVEYKVGGVRLSEADGPLPTSSAFSLRSSTGSSPGGI